MSASAFYCNVILVKVQKGCLKSPSVSHKQACLSILTVLSHWVGVVYEKRFEAWDDNGFSAVAGATVQLCSLYLEI